ILACWMGGAAVAEGRRVLNDAGIPTFDAPEAAIRAFLHMVQYRRNQELLYETPPAMPAEQPDAERVRRTVAAARAEGREWLSEAEAKDVLAAYDIPVARTVPCTSADEAVR